MNLERLKELLRSQDAAFWDELAARSLQPTEFDELFALCSLRKKAYAKGLASAGPKPAPLRLALLGGCSLYPLRELVEHLLDVRQIPCQLFVGEFDNYVSEIMEPAGKLYEFQPQCVLLIPSEQRCKYQGNLSDAR